MSPALPEGEDAPASGELPQWTAHHAHSRNFGVYIHIPYCSVRCGYCDFNTYTATELGGGASQRNFANTACQEIDLAGEALRQAGFPDRQVTTVFFGGGTPTMLPAEDLVRLLHRVRDVWGLAPDAEVTTEANPDSVTPEYLRTLAAAGFTRVSIGMQSSVPHVLATLERTHNPANVPHVVQWAHDAGLQTSVDLIYGTPGESLSDWEDSVRTAIATGAQHVSAYALVVEDGTKMAAQVRRGQIALPSADDQAEKYERVDELLSDAGFEWYEISNWSRRNEVGEPQPCRHNLAYWRGHDWWGVGPGAHSYLGGAPLVNGKVEEGEKAGIRWWNVKHPVRYAAALEQGNSPAAGREILTAADAQLERVMLGIRMREGLPVSALTADARPRVAQIIADGLVDPHEAVRGTLILTRRGRLLADAIVRDLT
ncbi:radical SAM family heme chaperone HemW [Jonesia quinghaiensis]|uniref:radical SAM family heme chaperone HemW n=1 Tax=Jonesia quinghaiensis TaxID=262806 RepID=UPI0003F65DB9|nr:radical SAM family heme chaperone HemW [Jonesia quinghaiensis]